MSTNHSGESSAGSGKHCWHHWSDDYDWDWSDSDEWVDVIDPVWNRSWRQDRWPRDELRYRALEIQENGLSCQLEFSNIE